MRGKRGEGGEASPRDRRDGLRDAWIRVAIASAALALMVGESDELVPKAVAAPCTTLQPQAAPRPLGGLPIGVTRDFNVLRRAQVPRDRMRGGIVSALSYAVTAYYPRSERRIGVLRSGFTNYVIFGRLGIPQRAGCLPRELKAGRPREPIAGPGDVGPPTGYCIVAVRATSYAFYCGRLSDVSGGFALGTIPLGAGTPRLQEVCGLIPDRVATVALVFRRARLRAAVLSNTITVATSTGAVGGMLSRATLVGSSTTPPAVGSGVAATSATGPTAPRLVEWLSNSGRLIARFRPPRHLPYFVTGSGGSDSGGGFFG